jgi:hypothetical protein
MNEITVFQSEINDGVAEAVKSQASVAYCSSVTVTEKSANPEIKVLAENLNQFDLYYLEAVLVSTGWNKNDDVFIPEATWAARNSPVDKQFNFMHDENDIIGHITGSYAVDADGKTIADDIEVAPEQFDIITRAVIYNSWTAAKNVDRMEHILAEIAEGKWFVSMECLFAGFDYAMTNAAGETRLLARSEETAFLTKHLRVYGGTGKYEGWDLGRGLKSIAFSGKGLVSNPANPRSVILDNKARSFVLTDTDFSIGEFNMSDVNVLQKQVDALEASLAEARTEASEAKAAVITAKDTEYAARITEFEGTVAALEVVVADLQAKDGEAKVAIEAADAALTEAKEALVASEASVKEFSDKEKQVARLAELVKAGCDEAQAVETVEAFAEMSDAAFKAAVAVFDKFEKKDDDKKDDKKDKKKDAEASEDDAKKKKKKDDEADASEVFDDVETTEAALVVEAEDAAEEALSTRKSIASWLETSVLKTKNVPASKE